MPSFTTTASDTRGEPRPPRTEPEPDTNPSAPGVDRDTVGRPTGRDVDALGSIMGRCPAKVHIEPGVWRTLVSGVCSVRD
jgi:hypothetical protein